MSDSNRDFSSRLRQAFDFASMAEVGRRLNVPHATVRNYFGGRLPAPEVLIKIANETNVSLNWLLIGTGEMFADKAAREPGKAFEALVTEIVDKRLADREANNAGETTSNSRPVFDIERSIRRYNDPQRVLNDWYVFDGLTGPKNYGVAFFRGWESFTTEQKVDAIRDARRVLDRGSR